MPHLIIEYTANLTAFSPSNALWLANQALINSGLFAESDIKSRALCLDQFLVGTGCVEHGYVHARLELLSGRTDEQRKTIAHAVMSALTSLVEQNQVPVQVSVETVEIHAVSYAKTAIRSGS